ncbi:MAG: hypothetical protein NVSMB57_06080 [Actinomycetota bacterium]
MTRQDAGFEGPTADNIDEAIRNQAAVFKNSFPGMLGVHMLAASREGATATLEVGPSVLHPGGYAHGGAIAGFGDTIAAWATFPNLAPGQSFTTIEFKANFLSGVRRGTLHGDARVVHAGRRTIVIEVRIESRNAGDDPKLVAIMIVTQAVLGSGTSTTSGSSTHDSSAEVSPE